MKRIILLNSFIVCAFYVMGQTLVADSLNVINHTTGVAINTSQKVFKIVHIGDSHIQADMFSGQVRKLIQQKYGNAGVGLVFPYKQIKTNGPSTFTTTSPFKFAPNKVVKCKTACEVGLAAYNAVMPTGASFMVNLKGDTSTQYVSALFQSSQANATILVNNDEDTASYQVQDAGNFIICSYNKQLAPPFTISAKGQLSLQGLIVSNGQTGVLYYTIGANGATFNNYNNSTLFFDQLKALQPDLVIVSLGTNESVSDISPENFINQVDSFNNNLLKVCAQEQIIYTTPADNYVRQTKMVKKKVKGKWRKKRVVYLANNVKLEELQEAMVAYFKRGKFMYWNLYAVMGGDTSMRKWVEAGLAAKDHIHFNKAGYELQGELFYRALIKAIVP